MISRQHGERVVYTVPKGLDGLTAALVEHAVNAYGFLLNTPERRFREFTWPQFAEVIEQHYAQSGATLAVCRALRSREVSA